MQLFNDSSKNPPAPPYLVKNERSPRRGNSHIEFLSMLRIVSVVIHHKAPISLDIFISYLSQIMVIVCFTKFFS